MLLANEFFPAGKKKYKKKDVVLILEESITIRKLFCQWRFGLVV